MKIDKIVIRGFKGIKYKEYNLNEVVQFMMQKNGAGKTSFLEAIRYGLTGILPTEPINMNENEASVTLYFRDIEFQRVVVRTYSNTSNKTFINGKATSIDNANKFLEDEMNISVKNATLITSSELSAMNSKQFNDFLLTYLKDTYTFSEIVDIVRAAHPTMTEKTAIAALKPVLKPEPMKIYFDDIAAAHDKFIEIRKELKRNKSTLEVTNRTLIQTDPGFTVEEATKELEDLLRLEGSLAANIQAKKDYEAAVLAQKTYIAKLEALCKEEAEIKATEPNEVVRKQLVDSKMSVLATIDERKDLIKELISDNALFERTLTTIDGGICPVTNRACNSDMGEFKDEITDKMNRNIAKISKQNKVIEKLEESVADIEKQIKEFDLNADNYNQKLFLQGYIKDMKASMPHIPQKPADVEVIDFAAQKKTLNMKINAANSYITYCENVKQISILDIKCKIYDALAKDFDITGCVYKHVVDKYLSILTDEVNEKAKILKTGCSVLFENNRGISIKCKMNESEDYRSFASLSAGEQQIILFLMVDLCNSLSGLNILILDDLDKLDEHNFNTLLSLATSPEAIDAYDHIFLAAVDHADTREVLTKNNVNIMS